MRNNKIDAIRSIGTFLVILAHVFPPLFLQNIRTFDVIALVFISGVSFAKVEKGEYNRYLYKRFKKLVLPTYIVITSIFAITYLLSLIFDTENIFTINQIIKSYFFIEGIGYIWIVKVYIMIAIFSVMAFNVNEKIKNDNMFILIIFSLFVLYFSTYGYAYSLNILIINEYIIYLIPYLLIFLIGIRIKNSIEFLKKVLLLSFVSLILMIFFNYFMSWNILPAYDKYPPGYLYILYGLCVSSFLFLFLPNMKIDFFTWISKNSFKIYLFHIYFIFGIGFITKYINYELINNWLIQYILILTGSISATILFNRLTKRKILVK